MRSAKEIAEIMSKDECFTYTGLTEQFVKHIVAIQREALEESAKVADSHAYSETYCSPAVAAAIRKLAEGLK